VVSGKAVQGNTIYLSDLHEGLRCVKHQVGLVRERQAGEMNGRGKKGNKKNKAQHEAREGEKLQYDHVVFRLTFTHHPVPVRSMLNSRLGPDDYAGRKSGRSGKMFLGSRLQTRLAAWQTVERALHLFLYMWSDAALRARVDGEDAGIRAAFCVPIHSASAVFDRSLEGFCVPTVQERGVEAVSGGVAVGEHERLLGV